MASLPEPFSVCSWNILTTYTGNQHNTVPQEHRLPSIVDQITEIDPDICGLYEVRDTTVDDLHTRIGHDHSLITPYSHELHGMSQALTSRLEQTDAAIIDYKDGNRKGLVATIDGIAVVASHLSYEFTRFSWRTAQVADILQHVGSAETAIIMGDFNCLPWQKPRRMLEAAGFTSVMKTLHPKSPVTFPTPQYLPLLRPIQQLIVKPGLSIDDIYIKGLRVIEGGLIEGDSDHYGLWAKLARRT